MKYNLIDERIAEYFKSKRKNAKYSSYYVAERLGIPKSTYYYYELGERSMPEEIMKKLLNLYNDDGNELLNLMQKEYEDYLLRLFAYFNGYRELRSINANGEETIEHFDEE